MADGQLVPIDDPDVGSSVRFVNLNSAEPLPDSDSVAHSAHFRTTPRVPFLNLNEPVQIQTFEDEAIDVQSVASQSIETASGAIWVEGNSVLCGCPDCNAPMSVRLWLMVADCWKCRTSIELTPEQQRAARRLLRQQQQAQSRQSRPVTARPKLPVTPPTVVPPANVFPEIAVEPQAIGPSVIARADGRLSARLIRRAFSSMPAWLVSFLLHLIALMILALILLPQLAENPSITLSTFVAADDTEGGDIRMENPQDELQDDLPLAQQLAEDDEEIRDVIQKADQDAKQLLIDPLPTNPRPDLDVVKKNITTRTGPVFSFAARDPRVRAEIVKREGGTTLTEAAVSRGLRWLASVQNLDGSWSLAKYDRSDEKRNRGDIAATSLALLPFLGAGQTHEHGLYKETVAKGLMWILNRQGENGDLRDVANSRRQRLPSNMDMYAHGQATIVLIEAFAMTGDERFRDACQRAVQFIEKAQHSKGGWRYTPKQPGDTSVFGWQLMALQSARSSNLGLNIDPSTFELADQYLDLASRSYRRYPAGSLYRYQPSTSKPTPAMTAEAILCRMYLGWRRDNPRITRAVDYLVNENPPNKDDANIYYWYYATQALHHYGGRQWKKWNTRLGSLLVLMQTRRGRYAGSWEPDDFEWGRQGERIFVTSLAICTLEVYYRHLPLFKQLEIE